MTQLRGFDSDNLSDSLKTRPERWVSGCELGLAGTLDASLSDPAMVQSRPCDRVLGQQQGAWPGRQRACKAIRRAGRVGRARMRMADIYYPASDVRAEQPWANTLVPKGPEVPAQTKLLGVIRNSTGFPSKQIFVLWV